MTVDTAGFQFSPSYPGQVPNKDKHTYPELYKLGLNLKKPSPVVRIFILGGTNGNYSG
jgi:hypothetical protein